MAPVVEKPAVALAIENRPAWDHIDTVLLDLDGTLLDLAFDNHFWLEVVPAAYAASHLMTLEAAREALAARFRACEGTLPWYCIDHWTRELGLDIVALSRTYASRIAWLAGAREFLRRLRENGKRLVLLTNAHPRTLQIKDEHVGVTGYFDAAFSSHTFGVPKETARFWEAVRTVEPFDPRRSLFVDDSPAVLRAAREAGIRWIYGIRLPDSSGGAREHAEAPLVDSVGDLIAESTPA
jgi:putative hydrolase of the HAD superfamily